MKFTCSRNGVRQDTNIMIIHHTKYFEIDGVDEVVMMCYSAHRKYTQDKSSNQMKIISVLAAQKNRHLAAVYLGDPKLYKP